MPVVIDQFEVLPGPTPAQPVPESTSEDHPATAKLETLTLAPVLARLAERAMRVWAH